MGLFKNFKHEIKKIKHIVFDGYNCCEIASLHWYLSKSILPKIKIYKNNTFGYPSELKSLDAWHKLLDDMIYALDIDSKDYVEDKEVDWKRVSRGFRYLGKYWRDLWI
jgi:hypothetical protein